MGEPTVPTGTDEQLVDLVSPAMQSAPSGPSAPPTATDVVVDLRVPVPSIVGERFVVDDTHEADVFGPNDSIVSDIIELEVQQLIDLGDREDESRAWLIDRTACAWIALFETGAERVAENILGILRITGPGAADRVLRDLAVLQGRDVDELESMICAALGVRTIRPFVDFTTLDITKFGARTLRDQAHNFARLLTVLMVGCSKIVVNEEAWFSVALVHPQLWKAAARIGVPYDDPGFGIMDYKLSDINVTPMQTQLIVQNMVDVTEAALSGQHPFMKSVGLAIEANGVDLDALHQCGLRLTGRLPVQ